MIRSLAIAAVVIAVGPAGVADAAGGYARPIDVVASEDGRWLVVVNAADTVALVDRASGVLTDAVAIGPRPVAVARLPNDRFLVAELSAGCLVTVEVTQGRLVERGRLRLGREPSSVAASPDGRRAYVALSATGQVAEINCDPLRVDRIVDIGPRPASVAASPDGRVVAAVCPRPMQIVLIDVATHSVRSRHPFQGFNPGRMVFSPDAEHVYIAFTYDGGMYPSPGHIRRGWVTGSRVGRLRIADGRLEGLTLDVSGRAVGDVDGLALTPGGELLVTAGGTHEVLGLVGADLPWGEIGATELMIRSLARDAAKFFRIDTGGRPLGISLLADGRTALVANALLDEIQEIDVAQRAVVRAHAVAQPGERTADERLVRAGEEIFYDARRSLDQWYSCHTCHYNGGGNTVTFDTRNDGSTGTYKTVLPLWGVVRTGPWTWHGWQQDLHAALEKSLVDSMQGPQPSPDDVVALAAFLGTIEPPPSPYRGEDGGLSPAAERGRALFASSRTGCSTCHGGADFTSAELHDVGLGKPADAYKGFSAPTLRGLHRKTMFLHDGRSKSLHDLLTGPHAPDAVSGLEPLADRDLDDLIAYLQSL